LIIESVVSAAHKPRRCDRIDIASAEARAAFVENDLRAQRAAVTQGIIRDEEEA